MLFLQIEMGIEFGFRLFADIYSASASSLKRSERALSSASASSLKRRERALSSVRLSPVKMKGGEGLALVGGFHWDWGIFWNKKEILIWEK